MNNELIKQKWLEAKPKVIVFTCLVLCFISGYGAGRGEGPDFHTGDLPLNYNTNAEQKVAGKADVRPSDSDKNCPVKGNISANGDKTYHVKGGAFYNRTTAEECFLDEASAIAKGYRKSDK